MKFWVGVTDNSWFEFLRSERHDEVNFWQPSGTPPFTKLPPGTPFLFKLKRPYHHIGGGGYFVSYVQLPMSVAWDTFGRKNGAATYQAFVNLVKPLSPDPNRRDPEIGCTILSAPFFFPAASLVAAPEDWANSIVRGKSYDTDANIGGNLFASVMHHERLMRIDPVAATVGTLATMVEQPAAYGVPRLIAPRIGQGAFRALVTKAYHRKCAITGENILPVLDAAHIKPFACDGPNNVYNGLLLRSDFHKLFDLGYVTVTPDLRVEVSKSIHDEWFNGKAYYRLHGSELAGLPDADYEQPKREFLEWHADNVFRR